MFFAIRQEVCLSSEQLELNVGLPIIEAFFLPADMIFQVCKMCALSSHQKAVKITSLEDPGMDHPSPKRFSPANPSCQICQIREIWRVRGMRKKVERWRPPIESVAHCHSGGGAKNQTAKRFFGGKNLPGNSGAKRSAKMCLLVFLVFFLGRVVTVTTGTHVF